MMMSRKTASFLIFLFVALWGVGPIEAQTLAIGEVRALDDLGNPVYLDQTVTIQGVAAVDSGLWHDSANYFSIVDPACSVQGILVYLPGTTQPPVRAGSLVEVTGQLANRGYATDVGSLVVLVTDPDDVRVIDPDHGLIIEPQRLATDATRQVLSETEGGFVQIEGRLFDYGNSGIVRGFWLDGSHDGNMEDGQGSMYVKFYNYSGIDISELHNGSYVVTTGILLKADERHGGYYIRPVHNECITEISEKSVSAEFFGPQGLSFELGTPIQMREYGLIELISLQTSLPLDREMYPEWNPDGGSLIATIGVEQGARITREAAERNLFLNGLGSSAPQQLTFAPDPHAYPRWSSDGKSLVFALALDIDEVGGNWDIFYWDLENDAVKIVDHASYDLMPTWSPDDKSIIFASNRNGKWDLWWQALDSQTAVQVTAGRADVLFPDWSEAGLLFQRRSANGRFELWKADVVTDTGVPVLENEICLTADLGYSNVHPRWSPKGDRIVFMSSSSGQWDLWLMDADGYNKERLTKFPGNYLFPAWHPNGRRLACVGELEDNRNPSLYLLDVSGALGAKEPEGRGAEERTALPSQLAPNLTDGPIQNITWPLLTQPALVLPGSELSISLRDVPEEQLSVLLHSSDYSYTYTGALDDGRLTFSLPENTPPGLYDLHVRSTTLSDQQPRAVAVRKADDNITFAIVTDIHPELSYSDPNSKLRPIIQELNDLQLDFAIFTGDLLGRSADNYPQDYPDLYQLLKAEARFPFFMLMGNHDGKIRGSIDGFSYWQGYFGQLYYTFDVGNWQFVAINTYDHPDYPSENGFIRAEQLHWLEAQLQLAQSKQKPVIAFVHHNPFDSRWKFVDQGQRELRDILEIYGVSHVFAGHRHSNQLEQTFTTTIVTTASVDAESGRDNYRLWSLSPKGQTP